MLSDSQKYELKKYIENSEIKKRLQDNNVLGALSLIPSNDLIWIIPELDALDIDVPEVVYVGAHLLDLLSHAGGLNWQVVTYVEENSDIVYCMYEVRNYSLAQTVNKYFTTVSDGFIKKTTTGSLKPSVLRVSITTDSSPVHTAEFYVGSILFKNQFSGTVYMNIELNNIESQRVSQELTNELYTIVEETFYKYLRTSSIKFQNN